MILESKNYKEIEKRLYDYFLDYEQLEIEEEKKDIGMTRFSYKINRQLRRIADEQRNQGEKDIQ